MAVVMLLVLAGCGKNNGSLADDPTQAVTPAGSTQAAVTPTSEQTPSPTQEADVRDNLTTQEPTQDPAAQVSPTDEPTPEPTSQETQPTAADPGTDDDPEEKDAETIREYWNDSFLIWLPLFDKGSFESFSSDETHDFIKLSGIKADSVKKYIEKLTGNGFDINRTFTDKNGTPAEGAKEGSFCYFADNDDGWHVSLEYDGDRKTLVIGSGYEDVQNEDVYAQLRNETALAFLPEFTYGEYDSSSQDDDMQYVIFTASEADCRKYIGRIKEAGFTVDADEGDGDGILWYNAADADGHLCEFIYSGGMVKIGCGYDR